MPILKRIKEKYWIVVVIIVSCLIALIAFFARPTPSKREGATLPKLVEVIEAKKVDEPIDIVAFGVVQAMKEVTLKAEVTGRVIYQSEDLVLGGILKEKQPLIRLDPRDYQNIVQQEKASYQKAVYDLEVEAGRQIVAKREWEEISPSIKLEGLSEHLALRKPHLEEKQAALEAAKSKLDKAHLDLLRTNLFSPMNAVVISETVEVGDLITPQTSIAKLVATDEFRVQLSLPISKLKWINIPKDDSNEGSKVQIVQDLGEKPQVNKGRVLRLLGDLDPSGRMTRLLVAIPDPLNLKNEEKKFPLLIGTYVKAEIKGPVLKNVIVLPRKAIREGNTVWIKNENDVLEIRQVNIIQKGDNVVIIDKGLDDGDLVITSHLPIPIPGMDLKILEDN